MPLPTTLKEERSHTFHCIPPVSVSSFLKFIAPFRVYKYQLVFTCDSFLFLLFSVIAILPIPYIYQIHLTNHSQSLLLQSTES